MTSPSQHGQSTRHYQSLSRVESSQYISPLRVDLSVNNSSESVAALVGASLLCPVATTAVEPHTEMKLQGVIRTPHCQLGQQTVCAARPTPVGQRRLCVTAAGSGSNQQESSIQISRRDLGYAAAALSLSQLLTNSPAFAEGSGGDQQAYIDPEDAFKLILPPNWASSEVRCRHVPQQTEQGRGIEVTSMQTP